MRRERLATMCNEAVWKNDEDEKRMKEILQCD